MSGVGCGRIWRLLSVLGGVLLVTSGLEHEYKVGTVRTATLNGVSCSFDPGLFTAIMGLSGSGKSTLLHCLADMLRPTTGEAIELFSDVAESGASAVAATHDPVVAALADCSLMMRDYETIAAVEDESDSPPVAGVVGCF